MSDEATETTTTASETATDASTIDASDVDSAAKEAGRGDRDDLLDALKNAPAEEAATEDGEPPAAAATETAAAEKAPEAAKAAAGAPTEPKIAAVIRSREEARKKVQEAQGEGDRIRQEAQREAEQLRTQAKADAEKWKADEAARFKARFGEAPLEALNEYGVPREKLVDDVAKDGTPEGRMMKRIEAERAADQRKIAALEEWKANQEKQAQETTRQAQLQARARVEQEFLAQHANKEKTPFLAKLPPRVVLAMAHEQADEWRKDGIPFDNSDIAEYLEHQIRTSLGGSAESHQVAAPSGNSAPKAKANGTRTLNAQGGSERRASPKPFEDLDMEDPTAAKASLVEAYRDGR